MENHSYNFNASLIKVITITGIVKIHQIDPVKTHAKQEAKNSHQKLSQAPARPHAKSNLTSHQLI